MKIHGLPQNHNKNGQVRWRKTSSIRAWPNSLDWRPLRYCIVSPLLQKKRKSIYSLNHVIVRPNKIMNILLKDCTRCRKGLEIKEFKTTSFIDIPLYLYHYPIFSSCLYNIHQPEEILFSHIRYVFPHLLLDRIKI